MTRLTDGNRTVEISLMERIGSNWTPDFSAEFFEVGGLEENYDADAYIVDDVDYCIGQAYDWASGSGDFYDDSLEDSFSADNRLVDVTDL